jgi:hypothetical protein
MRKTTHLTTLPFTLAEGHPTPYTRCNTHIYASENQKEQDMKMRNRTCTIPPSLVLVTGFFVLAEKGRVHTAIFILVLVWQKLGLYYKDFCERYGTMVKFT